VPALTFEFGSRSGSWFALVLFAVLFAILGWGVAREFRRRAAMAPLLARTFGAALFAGPLLLVYASSLGGFYDAELDGPALRMLFLLPATATETPLTDVTSAEPQPWYRGRWRLVIVASSGARYESATWHREQVLESAARIKRAIAEGQK